MTEPTQRIGATRDVPPPRPVRPAAPGPDRSGDGPAWLADDGGLGRAARAVADAVSGLLGGTADEAPAAGQPDLRRSAGALLRDVAGAVASAVSSAAGGRGEDRVPGTAADEGVVRNPVGVLGDLLAAAAPRLPIRDAVRLRAAYPGSSDDEIADALVARASRLTAAVGAATGGLFAAQWFAPPSLLALPLEMGAETLLTAGVEVVLLGELHEVYGRPAPGSHAERAAAYLSSWTQQRAVQGGERQGLAAVLGAAGFRALRRRLSHSLARSVGSAAPLLIGAALGGRVNLKATETLARRVRSDLQRGRS